MGIICTADGSHTLESSIVGECYHSTNGALQESRHVFINAGLKFVSATSLNILEVGFGTGLNTLLTLLEVEQQDCEVYYETVEKFSISVELASQLNYCDILGVDKEKYFIPLHKCGWDKTFSVAPNFNLKKVHADLQAYHPSRSDFNLAYFDAFAPSFQPDLWSVEVFSTIYRHMQKGGVLVTYSSKGLVKQHLREVGFVVERLEGAMGKRHMLRAVKC